MEEFNDATKQFWWWLVGRHVGVNEINNEEELRELMGIEGIDGDILFPGYAYGDGGGGSVLITDNGAGLLSTTSTAITDDLAGTLATTSTAITDSGTGLLSAA